MLQLQQMINTEMQQHRSTPPPSRIAIAPTLAAATTITTQHNARASSADETARVLRGFDHIDSTDAIAMSSLLALDALSSPTSVAAATAAALPLTTQHVAAHSLLSLSPSLSAAVAKKAADELDLNRHQSDTSDVTVEAATLLTTVTAAIPTAHPPMPSRTLSRRSARSPLTIVPPPAGSIRAFIAQAQLFTGARQRHRADADDVSAADRIKTEDTATVDDGETNGGDSDGGDNDDDDQVNGDDQTPGAGDIDDEMSDGGYRAMTGDIALSPTTQNIHNILMIAKQQQMEQITQRAQGTQHEYRHDRQHDGHVEALELETTSDMEHKNGDEHDEPTENGSSGVSSDVDSDGDRRTTHRARKKDDGNTARRRRRSTKRAEPARTRERDHSHVKDKRRTARAKSSISERRTHARGRAADNNSDHEEGARDEVPTYTSQNKRRKNKRQQHATSQRDGADEPQQPTFAHDVQQIPSFLKQHVIHDAAANALAEAVAASAFVNALPQNRRPDMQNLPDGDDIGSQRKKRQRKPRDAATDLLTTVAALVPPLDTATNDTILHAAKTLSAASAALPSASLASRREAVSPIGVPKKRRLSSKVHTYNCPICAKSFNDASSLRKHLKIHGDRQFQCDECDKRFIDNSKLKRHQLVHSGQRKFICPYPGCNKKFALDFNLKSHSRVHTGEKPFPCAHPNCGRRFAQVSNLKAHYKTHSAAATTTTHAATNAGGRSTTPNTLGDTATVDTAVVINGALYPPFFPTAIPTAGAYLNSSNVSVIAMTPRSQAATNNNNNHHNFGFDATTTTTTSTQHS